MRQYYYSDIKKDAGKFLKDLNLDNLYKSKIIAIDGYSGSGKSTIASFLQKQLNAALIPIDDFFSATIPIYHWEEFTIEEKLENVFDWDRLRNEVIIPLFKGETVYWRSFDFASGLRTDGTYRMADKIIQRDPSEIILLDGAYSSGPKLFDLLDITILINTAAEERRKRLEAREEKDFLIKWNNIWDEVEKYYFSKIRPENSFDIVINCS